jgi:glycerol-3-phosphate acyltransferase PlsY
VALPILVVFTPHQGGRGFLAFTTVLAMFVVWAHRSNIGRLLRGEENRFERKGATSEAPTEDGS